MRIVCLSDTHGYHKLLKVPDGDMLICAGDFSMSAKLQHVVQFADWFKSRPHKYKIIVAGNHDMYCEDDHFWTRQEFFPAIYLNHEAAEVGGLKIFGSPYSCALYQPSPWAFDYDRKSYRSEQLWSRIPEGLDILITHGPPKGILDLVDTHGTREDPNVGDVNLLYHVKRTLPKVHIFGHIHEGYGAYENAAFRTRFYNVSACDVRYNPSNPVTVFDL